MNQFNSEVDALKHCDEMDSIRSQTPAPAQLLFDFISSVQAPVLAILWDRVSNLLARNRRERWEEFFDALRNDLMRKLQNQDKKLEEFPTQVDSNRLSEIVTEGIRRSEQAATREKAKRLGTVAASGILRPNDPLELVTEFLRFAQELSETDILVLREMQKAQANCNPDRFQGARADDVRKVMNTFQVKQSDGKVLDYGYVKSSFARLQSLGLAIQLSSQSNTSPENLPFELLRLGNEFLEYIDPTTT